MFTVPATPRTGYRHYIQAIKDSQGGVLCFFLGAEKCVWTNSVEKAAFPGLFCEYGRINLALDFNIQTCLTCSEKRDCGFQDLNADLRF